MKNTWIKIGDAWKEAKDIWVKTNGVWKSGVVPKGYIEGIWKSFKNTHNVIPTNTITTDKLIRYWHHDNGLIGNMWGDMLNRDHVIVLTGATKSTNGIYFDGLDDYGRMDHPEISNTSLTVEMMVTLINPNKSGYSTLLDGDNPAKISIFNYDRAPLVRFYASGGGLYFSRRIEWGQQSHLVYTYDSVNQLDKVYVNGVLSGSMASKPTAKVPSVLGVFNTFDAIGDLHYVRMYSKELTPEEVARNYSVGIDVGLLKNAPKAVTNLHTALVSGSYVHIEWDSTAFTSSYIITRNGAQIAEVYSSDYKDMDLNKESTYLYEVFAKNDLGLSPPTSLSVTTTNASLVIVFEDFEDPDFNFVFTGDWIREANLGVLRSKAISHSAKSISTFEINIPANAFNIKFQFKYRVSSEKSYDKFTVSIGSEKVINEASGEIDWTTYSNTTLAAGTHTVTLEYRKDVSGNIGLDLVYLDDIELTYEISD